MAELICLNDPVNGICRAFRLLVATLSGDRVSVITRFDNATLSPFGLPRTAD